MKNSKELKKFKGRLKGNPTPAEKYFKGLLEDRGIDFKFQLILGFYILDFVIPSLMVNIEIDGEIHNERKCYDEKRDRFVQKIGFTVIRIKNADVYNYDLNNLMAISQADISLFRSALGRANAERGKVFKK